MSGVAGSRVTPRLASRGPAPASSVWGFQFLHLIANVYVLSSYLPPLWLYGGVSVVLVCVLLLVSDAELLFMSLLAIRDPSGERSIQGLCPFFNSDCLFVVDL